MVAVWAALPNIDPEVLDFLDDVDFFVTFLATCVPILRAKLVAAAPRIVPKIVRLTFAL